MPKIEPVINGVLSADIRRLEYTLNACALKVETVKDCQDQLDEESALSARKAVPQLETDPEMVVSLPMRGISMCVSRPRCHTEKFTP